MINKDISILNLKLVEAGLPVVSVRHGKASAYEVEFADHATREQREAAASILSSFDPDTPDPREVKKTRLQELYKLDRWTEEERDEILRLLIEQSIL